MNSPPDLWDGVLRRLGADTAPVVIEAWLEPLVARQEAGRLVLVAPNAFHRERVRSRFADRIRALAEEIAGRPVELGIEVAARGDVPPCGTAPRPPPPPARVGPAPAAATRTHQLALPATFETFVTGPANALAREASFAIARTPELAFFPLFLAGEPGTGKSHLARAVVTEARRRGVERAL